MQRRPDTRQAPPAEEGFGVKAEILAVAGEAALVRLSLARGGQTVMVPKRVPLAADHWLVAVVGQEAADAIAGRLGGTYIHIPNAAGTRARVLAARRRGMTIGQIAQLLNRSERYVYGVLAEGDDRQLDIFDRLPDQG